jgi:hypothetical protein
LTKLKVSLVFFAVETKERKKERQTEIERETERETERER